MKLAVILALFAALVMTGCEDTGAPAPGTSDPAAAGKAAEQKGGQAPQGMSPDSLSVPGGASEDSGFGSAAGG